MQGTKLICIVDISSSFSEKLRKYTSNKKNIRSFATLFIVKNKKIYAQ
jgi:hypothetical protein